MYRVSVLRDQGDQIARFQPYRRGVVVRMHADLSRLREEVSVKTDLHPALLVVQHAERRDRARISPMIAIRSSADAKLSLRVPCFF